MWCMLAFFEHDGRSRGNSGSDRIDLRHRAVFVLSTLEHEYRVPGFYSCRFEPLTVDKEMVPSMVEGLSMGSNRGFSEKRLPA